MQSPRGHVPHKNTGWVTSLHSQRRRGKPREARSPPGSQLGRRTAVSQRAPAHVPTLLSGRTAGGLVGEQTLNSIVPRGICPVVPGPLPMQVREHHPLVHAQIAVTDRNRAPQHFLLQDRGQHLAGASPCTYPTGLPLPLRDPAPRDQSAWNAFP